jgi:hypothetical protein
MKLLRGLPVSALAFMLAPAIAFAQVSPGTSPLSVLDGGTGAATAAGARSNLQVDKFTGHGDSTYSIAASDRVVGTNASFTASRTWTLPAANAVNAGQALVVADFAGTVTGTNTLVIARAGSDTINGGASVTISTANGAFMLVSDGVSKWTAQAIGASSVSGISSLDGATGAIATQTGSLDVTGSTLSSNVLSSRAFAITQDLSAFDAVSTLGYAAAGDGGRATFKKIGSAPFHDSFITNLTVTNAGSGCTNGSYLGVYYGGGTGEGMIGLVTVSGGVVTAASVTTPGNRYTVGDTLTQNGFFTCSTTDPVFTVAALSTPSGSFTDAAGNRFQILADSGGTTVNVLQFGAKCDWHHSTGDAGATDDTTAIQNALNYGYGGAGKAVQGYVGAGGVAGMKVLLPTGYCKTASLTVPCYVMAIGPGPWSGGLKARDDLSASVNYIDVGDRFTHQACFGAGLYDMNIYPGSGAANSGTYMIYTNNVQQHTFLKRITVAGGNRGCINAEDGWGGAAMLGMEEVEAGSSQTTMPVMRLAYSTAVVTLTNVIVENGGTFCHYPTACTGVSIINGYVRVAGFHSEGIAYPINIFNVNPQGISSFRNLTCGAGTYACVTRQITATAGLNIIGASLGNNATLNNAGTLTTGNIVADVVF